jgi:hypothetical protein
MSKTALYVILGAFVLAAVIAVVVNQRLDYPKQRPWWAGRDPVVRLQAWEAGKDMPTVSMTIPKRTLDRMVALGFPPTISVGEGNELKFVTVWHDLQRLPRGRTLRFQDRDATLYLWIEPRGEPLPPDSLRGAPAAADSLR